MLTISFQMCESLSTSAGPKLRAGLIETPSTGMSAMCTTKMVKPIARGANTCCKDLRDQSEKRIGFGCVCQWNDAMVVCVIVDCETAKERIIG